MAWLEKHPSLFVVTADSVFYGIKEENYICMHVIIWSLTDSTLKGRVSCCYLLEISVKCWLRFVLFCFLSNNVVNVHIFLNIVRIAMMHVFHLIQHKLRQQYIWFPKSLHISLHAVQVNAARDFWHLMHANTKYNETGTSLMKLQLNSVYG